VDDKIIVLPNKEKMFKRLLKVSDDDSLQKRFYPLLLQLAGSELVVESFVTMLRFIIDDYTKNLSLRAYSLLYGQADHFIDVLVDDAEMAQQAKDFFHE